MAATTYTNAVLTFGDDDGLTTAYTAQKFPLYMSREEGGLKFRFVKFDASDVAITAGMVVYWKGTTMDGVVTADVSDSKLNKVAGITNAARADGTWGWIQRGGITTNVVSDGGNDGVAGDFIIPVGDGTADTMVAGTAPTSRVIGVALASEAAAKFPIVDLILE